MTVDRRMSYKTARDEQTDFFTVRVDKIADQIDAEFA